MRRVIWLIVGTSRAGNHKIFCQILGDTVQARHFRIRNSCMYVQTTSLQAPKYLKENVL